MNYSIGDIVKIGRTGSNVSKTWVGFVSELVSSTFSEDDYEEYASQDHFMLLYGNSIRKEYSEMNFWDCNVMSKPTDEEIRVYKEVLPYVKEQLSGIDKIRTFDGEIKYIKPYFNVFNGEVYATDESNDKIKVWDKSKGLVIYNNRRLLLTSK